MSEYGIRLSKVGNRLSWREFAWMVEGLLAADTRLSRHFRAEEEPDEETV